MPAFSRAELWLLLQAPLPFRIIWSPSLSDRHISARCGQLPFIEQLPEKTPPNKAYVSHFPQFAAFMVKTQLLEAPEMFEKSLAEPDRCYPDFKPSACSVGGNGSDAGKMTSASPSPQLTQPFAVAGSPPVTLRSGGLHASHRFLIVLQAGYNAFRQNACNRAFEQELEKSRSAGSSRPGSRRLTTRNTHVDRIASAEVPRCAPRLVILAKINIPARLKLQCWFQNHHADTNMLMFKRLSSRADRMTKGKSVPERAHWKEFGSEYTDDALRLNWVQPIRKTTCWSWLKTPL